MIPEERDPKACGCDQLGVRASLGPGALPAEVALAASTGGLPDRLTAVYLLTPVNHLPAATGQSQGRGRVTVSIPGASVSFSCQA